MNITYDRETDTMVITLRDVPIRESDEIQPGVIVDYGEDGGVARFELLEVSKVVENAREVKFTVDG